MGVFQLPDSVDGDAAGCLVYSFFCLFVNSILIWLIWTHHERTSYVAYISYFTCLATVSSIVQQLYDYILWQDIMIEQFYYGKQHAHDAETQYQRGIMGLKLALSYIRIFCFIVESTLVLFFSLSLAATVYGWWAKKPQALRKLSITGRIVPIVLALLSIILLQLEFTHQSFTLYFIIANAQLILSLAGSCVFLFMILCKYVQTRRQLKTWMSIQYGKSNSTATSSEIKMAYGRRSRAYSTAGKPSATFDKWLVIRLSIAFMTLCVFEWTNIAPRISSKGRIVESVTETEPDLSEKRAMSTVKGYLSGVSPSLLAFIVFGTTKTFQQKMYKAFLPASLRRKISGRTRDGDGDDDDNFACRNAEGRLPLSSNAGSSFARASTVVAVPPPPPPKDFYTTSIYSSTSAPTTPRTTIPKRASFLLPIQEPPTGGGGGGVLRQSNFTSNTIPIGIAIDDVDEEQEEDIEAQMMSPHASRRPLRRSQIGVAISKPADLLEPPKPTHNNGQGQKRRRATLSSLGTGTFFRDDSSESLQQAQQIPLSRFNVSKHDTLGGELTTQPTINSRQQFLGRTDSFASTTTTTTIWSEAVPPPRRGSEDHRALGRTRFGSVS